MAGKTLPFELVRDLLDDAAKLDIRSIRLYGGEPLLHKDLVRIVEHGVGLGLDLWLTTNGILLREKIDDLYAAGLRHIGVGFYGTGDQYDAYVQRKDRYTRLEAGVAYARDRYGDDVRLSLGWVLMKPTCSVEAVQETYKFAERYNAPIGVNLVHYSLPYFTEGPNRELTFRPEDRPQIEAVVDELLRLKTVRPDLVAQSPLHLRSIPDWLIRRSEMRVPCERYRLLWVGADGTLQLCYVTFKLGNLHESRLSELLFTPEHTQAARDAFQLNCPNCNCSFGERIDLHGPSRRLYS
jgi:cyclic pyranopterin phosphate synthase